jgi:hypothetical protein
MDPAQVTPFRFPGPDLEDRCEDSSVE